MKNPKIIWLIVLMCIVMPVAAARKTNALHQHASPYLAMHGQDPVDWHEWNAATVALARKQNKLLFVSSGYFSCHWCHVMQRESYQNEKIAALLNKYFIAVKVDREIDTALDSKLIDFVERTQQYSGWPLNVFITPDGHPLVGMVYVPPEDFAVVVEKIGTRWQKEFRELSKLAAEASAELDANRSLQKFTPTTVIAASLQSAFVQQGFQLADELQGGFGDESKFPSTPQLHTLLAIYKNRQDERIGKFLKLTLNQMANLGLRDQLGGGFYRYAVGPDWHIPHFEKMLYDNAQLAMVYLEAAEIFKEPFYGQIAQDTLDFMLREFKVSNGVFAASLSAIDDHNVEGGGYLWSNDELRTLLTDKELALVKEFWHADGSPELEGGHHLIQPKSAKEVADVLKLTVTELTQQLDEVRKKLLTARVKRIIPRDDKQLTAWNALALSAFVKGYQQFKKPEYQLAAQAIVDKLKRQWWDEKGNILYRMVTSKNQRIPGALEDYAYMAQGMYDWWQFTRHNEDKVMLEKILRQGWARFYTKQGWQLSQASLLKYGSGEALLKDNALPSASAVLTGVSLQFAQAPYDAQARAALGMGHTDLESSAYWHASQIRNFVRHAGLLGNGL